MEIFDLPPVDREGEVGSSSLGRGRERIQVGKVCRKRLSLTQIYSQNLMSLFLVYMVTGLLVDPTCIKESLGLTDE